MTAYTRGILESLIIELEGVRVVAGERIGYQDNKGYTRLIEIVQVTHTTIKLENGRAYITGCMLDVKEVT